MKQFSSEKKYIDRILKTGKTLPDEIINITPKVLVSLLRKRLRMTQAQLAKRLNLSQSYIAKIESGYIIPSISILEKIFKIFGCSLSIIVIPEKMPDELLKEQTLKAAKKKLKYVEGTMSLEKQLPNKQHLEELLVEEQNKLLHSNTSKIWDIDEY